MSATAQVKDSSVKARPFTVEQQWIEITVSIEARLVPFFEARTPIVRQLLGLNVWLFFAHCTSSQELETDESKAHMAKVRESAAPLSHLKGRKTLPFLLEMEKRHWNDIQHLSQALKLPVRALIRDALLTRYHELRYIDERRVQGGAA